MRAKRARSLLFILLAGLGVACGARSSLLDYEVSASSLDGGTVGPRRDASHAEGGSTFEAGHFDGTTPGDAARGDGAGDARPSDARGGDAGTDAGDGSVDAPSDTCPKPTFAPPTSIFWDVEGADVAMNYVTVGPRGMSATVGNSQGPFSIAGVAFDSPPNDYGSYFMQAFVTEVDGSGHVTFTVAFENDSSPAAFGAEQLASAAAFDPQGNLYVVGAFTGTIVFPGSPVGTLSTTYTPESADDPGPEYGFVVKLDASGQHVWSRSFAAASPGYVFPGRIAVDPKGDLVVAGELQGAVNLGAGDGGPSEFQAPARAPFVAKLTSDGDVVWDRTFGSADYGDIHDLAVDAMGNIYVAGSFEGGLGFSPGGTDGGTVLTCVTDAGKGCAALTGYIAKITTDGNLLWTRAATSPPPRQGVSIMTGFDGIAVDGQGNVGGVGWVDSVTIHPEAGPSVSVVHPFVASFGPDGTPGWTIDSDASAPNGAIAAAASGDLFVVTQSLAHVPLRTDAGAPGPVAVTSFLTRLHADGTAVWAKEVQGGFFKSIAVDPCVSEVVVMGGVTGSVSLPRAAGGSLVLDAGALDPYNPATYQAMVTASLAP
jgi:hypothetical protein